MEQSLIFGRHAVSALLQKHPSRVVRLLIQQASTTHRELSALLEIADSQGIVMEYAERHILDRLSDHAPHQGIIAFCKPSAVHSEKNLKQWLSELTTPPFLLLLDGIQDPHNLGACFRIADAAGVHAIIAPKDKAVGVTGVVSKVASGATETVPFFQVTNLARVMEDLKEQGIWLYGAESNENGTQSLYDIDFPPSVGIVLGSEGEGLRRLTRERCDALIHIPMHGTVASLNVAVATGIILFEVARRQKRGQVSP